MLHLAFSKQSQPLLGHRNTGKKPCTSLTFNTDKECPPQAIVSRPILGYFNLSCVFFTLKITCSQISSVQSLSRVWLFATPWIAACQASLSITNSPSSLKRMSIESVMPSSHLILCRSLLLLPPIPPSIRVFSNESTLRMRWQSTGVSALASVLPKKSQGWSPSEWTGWISLQSKGLSSPA